MQDLQEMVETSMKSVYTNPNQEPCVVKIDEEAAKDWLSKGAQPTDTVARLLKNAGIEK